MAGVPSAVPFRWPHGDAEGVSGWLRGRAVQSAGIYTHPDAGHIGTDMGQTIKLRGNPEGHLPHEIPSFLDALPFLSRS